MNTSSDIKTLKERLVEAMEEGDGFTASDIAYDLVRSGVEISGVQFKEITLLKLMATRKKLLEAVQNQKLDSAEAQVGIIKGQINFDPKLMRAAGINPRLVDDMLRTSGQGSYDAQKMQVKNLGFDIVGWVISTPTMVSNLCHNFANGSWKSINGWHHALTMGSPLLTPSQPKKKTAKYNQPLPIA